MENNLQKLEQKILLCEAKGVAAIPWRKNIINIVKEIQNQLYLKLEDIDDKSYFKIYIQNDDTKSIDFIDNLSISIDCYSETLNQKYLDNLDIGGSVITPLNIALTQQNQLPNIDIKIGVLFDDNGKIKQGVLCNTLYHELNHLYELYIDLMKNNRSYFHNKSSVIGNTFWSNNEDIDRIIYRLFSTTEMNALVASVYGDCVEMNINYQNYNEKIQQTQAWIEYQYIKNNYQNVVQNLNEEEIQKLKLFFKQHNIILWKNNSIDSFKQQFNNEIKLRLIKLLKKIIGVIGLYLDAYQEITEHKIKQIIHTTFENYIRRRQKSNKIKNEIL